MEDKKMQYTYTEKEKKKVLTNFMKEGRVTQVPSSEKKKFILLKENLSRFEKDSVYTEQEMNAILLDFFSKNDYVEQRRYLITFGLFDRSSDGSQYWLI